jgi:hypothetical protein
LPKNIYVPLFYHSDLKTWQYLEKHKFSSFNPKFEKGCKGRALASRRYN